MKLYNLKDHNEQVSFAQAVTQGLGKNQGLFFPHDLPEFQLTEIDELLKQDFVTRSTKILSAFIGVQRFRRSLHGADADPRQRRQTGDHPDRDLR